MFLHKLEMVQVTLRRNPTVCEGVTSCSRGLIIPLEMTKSRRSLPSPAMLPKAQTACSHTFWSLEESRDTKWGTAPADTTIWNRQSINK